MSGSNLWQQRNKELSETDHVDSKKIRIPCVGSITALYDGIEYQAAESDDPAWTQLVRELSQLGIYYRQQLRTRVTRRKNKAKNSEE